MVICKYFQQGCCKYGNNCRFDHVFGSKYSYSRAPQQNTANQNNFFNQASGNSASSLFRNAVQSNVPSVFGQNPASRPSVFDRLGHQPNSLNENQARSIFAQATQNVFAQANAQITAHVPQNPFTANPRSVFAQANQNVFAPTQHYSAVSQQNNAANLFASAAQNVSNARISLNPNPATLPPTNMFHISKPTNVFSGANSSFDLCDENLYSNTEDLSKTDIAAFENAEFKLGFIPELPPLRALCM